jgi:hypothetical protein
MPASETETLPIWKQPASHWPAPTEVPLTDIEPTSTTQSRLGIREATITEYTEMLEHSEPPPGHAFRDAQGRLWLSTAHHRYFALQRKHRPTIKLVIFEGSPNPKIDAIEFGANDNLHNGLPLTTGDKERVAHLIWDADSTVSAGEMSRRFKVSVPTASRWRQSWEAVTGNTSTTRTYQRGDQTITSDVSYARNPQRRPNADQDPLLHDDVPADFAPPAPLVETSAASGASYTNGGHSSSSRSTSGSYANGSYASANRPTPPSHLRGSVTREPFYGDDSYHTDSEYTPLSGNAAPRDRFALVISWSNMATNESGEIADDQWGNLPTELRAAILSRLGIRS